METEARGEHVLYLYGVIPAGQPIPVSEAAALQAVPFSNLVALVEPVSATEFSSQALKEKLQRIDWVSLLAQKHTAVLDEVMQHGSVVPARLCTLFSSAQMLQSSLVQNEERFQDKLERVRDRQEWGFKVFCDKAKLEAALAVSEPELRQLEAAAARASPGQAYVLRKKREARLAELCQLRRDEVSDEVLDVLEAQAADTRMRPLLSEATSGRSEAMTLNVAILIDNTGASALIAAAQELASLFGDEGFIFDPTGPWPPYSFCSDEEPDEFEEV
ncbi:GvpL/GvpF family gas vesicle protein [Hyalangium gracile]|uniref:GvpL/GvpF family gas vesicle protein n=1 Tax=Hyalangium gracile TaxID=394092 RepID=UPI001CCA4A99|nr:GvpL/GvpF family gas vesicle protein [Hyalangium gracile]